MTVIEFAEKRLNESCLAACDFAELMLKAGAFRSARPKGVIK